MENSVEIPQKLKIVSARSGIGFVIGSERNKIFPVIPAQNIFCFGFAGTFSQINCAAGLNGVLHIRSAQNSHENQAGKYKNNGDEAHNKFHEHLAFFS